MINRRDFLLASSAASLAATITKDAFAAAPMATTQVPGFYRVPLGQFQVTVVSDGNCLLPTTALWPKADKGERDTMLISDHQSTDKPMLQLNALVVNTGNRLVLVDAGSRGKWQPSAGRLLQNLGAAGIRPEDIDVVVISHAHPDHLWGVTAKEDNQPTFPNAEYVFSETELNFWNRPNHPLDTPEGWGRVYRENMKTFPALKDRVRTVKADEDVVTGIRVVALPGHTPGQIGVLVTSGSEALLTTADAVANRAVSFEHPEWIYGYDLDGEQGIATRRTLLDRAVADRVKLSSYHLPFPGLGYAERVGSAYRWVPVDFEWQLASPT